MLRLRFSCLLKGQHPSGFTAQPALGLAKCSLPVGSMEGDEMDFGALNLRFPFPGAGFLVDLQ